MFKSEEDAHNAAFNLALDELEKVFAAEVLALAKSYGIEHYKSCSVETKLEIDCAKAFDKKVT